MDYKKMWEELRKELKREFEQYDVNASVLMDMEMLEDKYKHQVPYKLFITEDGDWEALYKNGKLVHSNHSLKASDIVSALESDAKIYYISEETMEALNLEMPKDIKKVMEVI